MWPYHSIIKRWSLFLYHFLEKSVTALIGKSIVKVTLPIRNSACNGPDSFHFLFGAFASSWMPGAMYDVWLSWDHAGKTSHMEKLESEIPDMEWRSHLEIYSQARHSRLQMQQRQSLSWALPKFLLGWIVRKCFRMCFPEKQISRSAADKLETQKSPWCSLVKIWRPKNWESWLCKF